MAVQQVKMPIAKRLVRRVKIVDAHAGTTRQTLRCPICVKQMTIDSKPHYH